MNNYFNLNYLMNAYLNQDYDLICESEEVDEAIDYVVLTVSVERLTAILKEMNRFQAKFSANLDSAFSEQFPQSIDVSPVDQFFDLFRKAVKKYRPD